MPEISRGAFLASLPLALTTLYGGAADAQCGDHAWLDRFCDLFYRQKRVRDAFDAHVAPDYIQHSAGIGQGREAAIAALEPMFARPTFQATPIATLVDGTLALVVLDVRVGAEVRALVLDLFRLAGDRIVEHWDMKQTLDPVTADAFLAGLRRQPC
jgi:predicted SnoaL-like aldol condensation-catalyzing enzyme